MTCQFCGDDIDPGDLLHQLTCDGQQGRVEAETDGRLVVPGGARETSIQAFYNAVENGIIETRRAQVYVGLKSLSGPPDYATANEVFEHLKASGIASTLRYDSNTRARFTELRDLGLIREMPKRVCRVTGVECLTWAIVPPAEYKGPAVILRCKECGQPIAREVPV